MPVDVAFKVGIAGRMGYGEMEIKQFINSDDFNRAAPIDRAQLLRKNLGVVFGVYAASSGADAAAVAAQGKFMVVLDKLLAGAAVGGTGSAPYIYLERVMGGVTDGMQLGNLIDIVATPTTGLYSALIMGAGRMASPSVLAPTPVTVAVPAPSGELATLQAELAQTKAALAKVTAERDELKVKKVTICPETPPRSPSDAATNQALAQAQLLLAQTQTALNEAKAKQEIAETRAMQLDTNMKALQAALVERATQRRLLHERVQRLEKSLTEIVEVSFATLPQDQVATLRRLLADVRLLDDTYGGVPQPVAFGKELQQIQEQFGKRLDELVRVVGDLARDGQEATAAVAATPGAKPSDKAAALKGVPAATSKGKRAASAAAKKVATATAAATTVLNNAADDAMDVAQNTDKKKDELNKLKEDWVALLTKAGHGMEDVRRVYNAGRLLASKKFAAEKRRLVIKEEDEDKAIVADRNKAIKEATEVFRHERSIAASVASTPLDSQLRVLSRGLIVTSDTAEGTFRDADQRLIAAQEMVGLAAQAGTLENFDELSGGDAQDVVGTWDRDLYKNLTQIIADLAKSVVEIKGEVAIEIARVDKAGDDDVAAIRATVEKELERIETNATKDFRLAQDNAERAKNLVEKMMQRVAKKRKVDNNDDDNNDDDDVDMMAAGEALAVAVRQGSLSAAYAKQVHEDLLDACADSGGISFQVDCTLRSIYDSE